MANPRIDELVAKLKTKKGGLAVFGAVGLVVFLLLSNPAKKPDTTPSSASVALETTTKDMVPTALQDNSHARIITPELEASYDRRKLNATLNGKSGATDPSPRKSTVIIERSPAEPKTSKKSKSAASKTTPTRAILAQERIRKIYDVDYVPTSLVLIEGAVVEPEITDAIAPAVAATPTATTPTATDTGAREVLLPGTFFKVQLINGLVATSSRPSRFTGVLSDLIAPGFETRDYEDCMVYGEAQLDPLTTRVLATVTSISCPTKYVKLSSYAQGDDYTEGIPGQYYSQAPRRIALSAFPAGLQEYFTAHHDALEETSTYVTGDVIVQETNIIDPDTYAAYAAGEATVNSINEELAFIKSRTLPVNIVAPLTIATFFVIEPAEVTFLYTTK